MHGGEADSRPIAPIVPDTAVNFVKSINQINTQRKLTTAFLFRVTPVHPGTLTIPRIALRSHGVTYYTPPLKLEVHPLEQLVTLPSGIGNHQINVGWFPEKPTLYQGELCPVTLKLYVPSQLPVTRHGWGLPDPAKENCLAWRFSLPKTNDHNEVTINGTSYQSATFNTTLSGLTPGKATFGPAPLRIIVRQSVIDPLRGPRLIDVPVQLTLPAITFNILPLPKGAPSAFHGAVGNFSINANSRETALKANDSTEVMLHIRGRGNLETMRPPEFNEQNWKIIDSTKITRGEERRSIQGTVTFRQLLRPISSPSGTLPTTIPSYALSYFDPEKKSYHTIRTDPIPVQITASSTTPIANNPTPEKPDRPPEEMRNILGFINQPDTAVSNNTSTSISPRLWHLAPALLALIIIGIPIRKKIKSITTKHPDTLRKEETLNRLAQETDQRVFYRNAGHFIEQWLLRSNKLQTANPTQQQLQLILDERDDRCFQPDGKKADSPKTMDSERKKAIITLLKRCSKLTLILLIALVSTAQVTFAGDASSLARDAWKSENYQQAIDYYQQAYPKVSSTPADIHYNIGNCHHRLNHPALAALAWRRALIANPTHQQARQNLRYVELEQGSIVPSHEDWQLPLTATSPRVYETIFEASLWLFALTLLSLIILRPRGIKLTIGIMLLVITPVIATVGALAVHWYPDDHSFAPIENQAIVIKKSHLFQEAHRQEKSPRSLPAATLLNLDATRGPWCHVTTADGKHGWIPSKKIVKVIP